MEVITLAQARWEESNKKNMLSLVKPDTLYLLYAYLTNQAEYGHVLAAQILKR